MVVVAVVVVVVVVLVSVTEAMVSNVSKTCSGVSDAYC